MLPPEHRVCPSKGKAHRPNKMVKKQAQPNNYAERSATATCYYFMPLQRNSIAFFAPDKVCDCMRLCVRVCMCVCVVLLKYSNSFSSSFFIFCYFLSDAAVASSRLSRFPFVTANKNNEKRRQIKFAQIIIFFAFILFLYLRKMH